MVLTFEISNLQDIRQTREYARFMEAIGWKTHNIGSVSIFSKKLPLLPFHLVKILRHHKLMSDSALRLVKQRYHPFVLKQEPFIFERKRGGIYFKHLSTNNWSLLPTKTIWIDLSCSEKILLCRMKAKTRYNLKRAVKNKLTVEIIPGNKIKYGQLKEFYNLWSHNNPHNFLFKPHFTELKSLVESFGKKCFFVFIHSLCHSDPPAGQVPDGILAGGEESSTNTRKNKIPSLEKGGLGRIFPDSLVACSLQLTSRNIAFYWHNASTRLGKKLFAPTLCVWEAIKEGKRRKLSIFDFEGVWDERFPQLNTGWKGFTRFKQGFSGNY